MCLAAGIYCGAVRAIRLLDEPIIDHTTHASIGDNIQGPSLIEVPDWVENPLGRFYLYFADHKGAWIRLAYADELVGPWQVYPPGALHLNDSCFLTDPPVLTDDELTRLTSEYRRYFGDGYAIDEVLVDAITPHIASPDVHVDHDHQQIVMYFHGLENAGRQVTRVATSSTGLGFEARPEILASSYFRMFGYDGWYYALVMPGQFLRSRDPLSGFETGPKLFESTMRHSAVRVVDDELEVFWTRVGDAPESILLTRVSLGPDWHEWTQHAETQVLAPEHEWEGSAEPIEPSRRSVAYGRVNQLRDPAVFVSGERSYLLYAGGGESAIGIAELASSSNGS